MNNKAHLRPKDFDSNGDIIPMACEEEKGDLISREALKKRLQDRHDFWVNAWGGFSDMPLNDKSRVDELSSCIAEVVNAPTVNPCKDCDLYFKAMTKEEQKHDVQ